MSPHGLFAFQTPRAGAFIRSRSQSRRSHNAANELGSRQVETSGFGPYYHQYRSDDAGNMTDQRSGSSVPGGGGLMNGLRMNYDAWNRLVKTEHVSGGWRRDRA